MEAVKLKNARVSFGGKGEMIDRINSFDWETTELGPLHSWPTSLVTTLNMMLRAKVPMFLWWGGGLVQFYNDAYRPSFGAQGRHPCALGQKAEECWGDIWHIIKPLIDQVITTGEPVLEVDKLVPIERNNCLEDIYWTFSYSAIVNEINEVSGVLVICSETTKDVIYRQELTAKTVALEAALNNSEFNEKNIRNLMTQAPVAMALLHGETYLVQIANELMLELWGKTSDEVVNKPVFEGIPEAREQGLEELLHKVFITGESISAFERPVQLLRKGKLETVLLNFLYEPLHTANGDITGIIAAATDVTSMVQARRAIEESERQFRQLADSLPHIVWTARPDGYVDYYNKQWYDFTGFEESFGDESWVPILHPDDVELSLDKYYHAVRSGEPYTIEYRFKDRRTNGYRWFLGKAQPIKDSDGNTMKWFGSCTDIDAQKSFSEKLEQNVNERTLELKKINVELESFAYIASHDLQEPLRKIQTYADRIIDKEENNLSDAGREYFRRLQSAASRMQTLINDLLDYSRTNKASARPEPTNLDNILAEVLNEFKDVINNNKAIIESSPLGIVPVIPYQFRQVLQNLIGNSLKFARPNVPPVIKISKRVCKREDLPSQLLPETKYVHLTFSDNGIGFDNQYRHRIFEMFQRLNGRSEYEGTGIGLAIVNKIVENHKGYISAGSEPDNGSVFDIYLPA